MKTATQKLVLTQKGEVHQHYLSAIQNCRFDGNKIYYSSWKRNGRHQTLVDYSFKIIQILQAQKYKFELGNDAPRGGKDGNFIKVSSTARKFLQTL